MSIIVSKKRKYPGLENLRLLSPNEPITPEGVKRLLGQLKTAIGTLDEAVGAGRKTITLWNPNIHYAKNDIVLYFKEEAKQVSVEFGKRDFAFILVSMEDNNGRTPNYDIIEKMPDFSKSKWKLLNPMSYLLQDLDGMKTIVKEVMQSLMADHLWMEHGLVGGNKNIDKSLVRKDFTNLVSKLGTGRFSLTTSDETVAKGMTLKEDSNGVMEYSVRYSFDEKANQTGVLIKDRKYYLQKSPIWDESDHTIFAQKYIENNELFSVVVNGNQYNNLRYGTNVFHAHVTFPKGKEFLNDEYCVFFDTYENGQFVFGFDKADLMSKTSPTYDPIVSQPMLLNKTRSGFDIVLPIHTYFNSLQKYKVGVPWKNSFTLQVVGILQKEPAGTFYVSKLRKRTKTGTKAAFGDAVGGHPTPYGFWWEWKLKKFLPKKQDKILY